MFRVLLRLVFGGFALLFLFLGGVVIYFVTYGPYCHASVASSPGGHGQVMIADDGMGIFSGELRSDVLIRHAKGKGSAKWKRGHYTWIGENGRWSGDGTLLLIDDSIEGQTSSTLYDFRTRKWTSQPTANKTKNTHFFNKLFKSRGGWGQAATFKPWRGHRTLSWWQSRVLAAQLDLSGS